MSVDVGDIGKAKLLMSKLKNDKSFYNECSNTAKKKYSECLGSLQTYKVPNNSNQIKVFPILHPSPLNLCNPKNKAAFQKQIKGLVSLIS